VMASGVMGMVSMFLRFMGRHLIPLG
jgi:hypothetical protein